MVNVPNQVCDAKVDNYSAKNSAVVSKLQTIECESCPKLNPSSDESSFAECPWYNCEKRAITVTSSNDTDLTEFEIYEHVLFHHVRPLVRFKNQPALNDSNYDHETNVCNSQRRHSRCNSSGTTSTQFYESSMDSGSIGSLSTDTGHSVVVRDEHHDCTYDETDSCSSEDEDYPNEEMPYACLWKGCKLYKKPCRIYEWLETHLLEKHAGANPYVCVIGECRKRFSKKLLLEKHVNSHFCSKKLNETNGKVRLKCSRNLNVATNEKQSAEKS